MSRSNLAVNNNVINHIRIKRIDKELPIPVRAHTGDAGVGLDSTATCAIPPPTRGEPHAYSLTDDLKEGLKDEGEQFLGIESSGDWVVIDLGDILIHLMSAQYRAKYNIEEFLSKLKEAKA